MDSEPASPAIISTEVEEIPSPPSSPLHHLLPANTSNISNIENLLIGIAGTASPPPAITPTVVAETSSPSNISTLSPTPTISYIPTSSSTPPPSTSYNSGDPIPGVLPIQEDTDAKSEEEDLQQTIGNQIVFTAVTKPFDISPPTLFHGNNKSKKKMPGKIPLLKQTNAPESFHSLNSNLTSKFIKFPTNPIAPSTMFSLHSHLESEVGQLVKLFEAQQKELLKNFNQQANLIVASIVHNYSSEIDIPQTLHGDATNYKKVFTRIDKFKKTTGICYPPPQ